MPLITPDDLKAELVGFSIGPTTVPSSYAVDDYIDEIEAEVRALWVGADGVWPTDPTADAALYPKLTVLLGTKWRFLDAKYTAASTTQTPDSLTQARLAYNDRLRRIKDIAGGTATVVQQANSGPLVGLTTHGPITGSSFSEWTERRDRSLRYGVRVARGWTQW